MFIEPMRTNFYLAFLLLITLGACRGIAPEDQDVVVNTAPEFSVDLYQTFTPDSNVLGLWVESFKIYPCEGHSLQYTLTRKGADIQLTLLEISAPSPCVGAPAVAKTWIPFGKLSEGRYNLNIRLGQNGLIENNGILQVNADRCEMDIETQRGIRLQERFLQRIPEGLVWGYIRAGGSETQEQAFNIALKNITDEPSMTPAYYGYFIWGASGIANLHRSIDPPGEESVFVRRLQSGKAAQLRELLENFRSNSGGNPLLIRCWTDKGEY